MFNFRNFVFGSLVAGCTIAASANALQCQSEGCEGLGYSKDDINDCAKYVRCPYDENYKVCIQLRDEFTVGECPDGYTCDVKHKKTGCADGYAKLDGTIICMKRCTSFGQQKPNVSDHFVYEECLNDRGRLQYEKKNECINGYIISDDRKSCYDRNCLRDEEPNINGAVIASTEDGFIVVSCLRGLGEEVDKNGCVLSCVGQGTLPEQKLCKYGRDRDTGECCDSSGKYGDRVCMQEEQVSDKPLEI